MARVATNEQPSAFPFLFITGVAGSGTTVVTRLVSQAPHTVCLGGKYRTVPEEHERASLVAHYVNKATNRMWDRMAAPGQASAAAATLPHLIAMLRELPGYEATSQIVYKRSAPFNPGDRFRPDLLILERLFPQVRFLCLYRDPRATSFSIWRRGFVTSLGAAMVISAEQLMLLSAQLAAVPSERRTVIDFADLCRRPAAYAARLAAFCGCAAGDIRAALRSEPLDPGRLQRWQEAATPAQQRLLNDYFDEARQAHWPFLLNQARGPATDVTGGVP